MEVTEGDEDKDYGSLASISFFTIKMGRAHVENEKSALSPTRRLAAQDFHRARLSFHYMERTALLAFGAATTAQTTQTGDLRSESESGADWSGKLTEPIMNRWAHEGNFILHKIQWFSSSHSLGFDVAVSSSC